MILVTFCLVYIIALFIQQLSPQTASVLNKIKYQSSVVNVNNPNPNSTNHNHNPETKTPTVTGGCVVFKGQVSGTCVRGSNVLTPFVHRFLTIDDLPCQQHRKCNRSKGVRLVFIDGDLFNNRKYGVGSSTINTCMCASDKISYRSHWHAIRACIPTCTTFDI